MGKGRDEMTIREAIGFVDEMFPNGFSNETKTRWLSQCDAGIWQDVMLLPAWMFPGYSFELDADLPLLVPTAYEALYVYWLSAQMHKAYAELAEYANDAQLYNAARTRFVIWYADSFDPAHGGVMPLPSGPVVRQGESADMTVLLPYPAQQIETLRIRLTNGTDMIDEDDVELEGHSARYSFPSAQTLEMEAGVWTISLYGTTTQGERFEPVGNAMRLYIVSTAFPGVTP